MKSPVLLIGMLLLISYEALAQWTQVNVDSSSDVLTFEIPQVAFANPDTGYIAYSGFVQGYSAKPQVWWDMSVDSGYTWKKYAVSKDFYCHKLVYGHGWGLAVGYGNDGATLEWFAENLAQRRRQTFPDYKEFKQVSIISTDMAIFGAITKAGDQVIGQLQMSNKQEIAIGLSN